MPHKTVTYDLKENFCDSFLFFLQCPFYSLQNVQTKIFKCMFM